MRRLPCGQGRLYLKGWVGDKPRDGLSALCSAKSADREATAVRGSVCEDLDSRRYDGSPGRPLENAIRRHAFGLTLHPSSLRRTVYASFPRV